MAPEGGESVADVGSRLSAVLSSTEREFQGYICLYFDRIQFLIPYILFSCSSSMTCPFL